MAPEGPSSQRAQVLLAAYYGTAVLAGIIVALSPLPFPLDMVVLLALGIGATWIQYRMAGRDSIASSVSWLVVFLIVWLPMAWGLRRFPFGP